MTTEQRLDKLIEGVRMSLLGVYAILFGLLITSILGPDGGPFGLFFVAIGVLFGVFGYLQLPYESS